MHVTYDVQVCIHAGNCVKRLLAVFKVVDGHILAQGIQEKFRLSSCGSSPSSPRIFVMQA
jgi:hypothetical protein